MATVIPPATVYQEQLAHVGLGLPYWWPEQPLTHELSIGDVGFFDDNGNFVWLFNATIDDSAVNVNGVPDGFKPLRLPRILLNEIPNVVDKGPFYSRGIEVRGGGGDVGAYGIGGGISMKVKSDKAAFLTIPSPPHQVQVYKNRLFPQYMRKNRKSWFDFAQELGLDPKLDDLIIIKGVVKTTNWVVGMYLGHSKEHEVKISANDPTGVAGFVQAGVWAKVSHSQAVPWQTRTGPSKARDRRASVHSSTSIPASPNPSYTSNLVVPSTRGSSSSESHRRSFSGASSSSHSTYLSPPSPTPTHLTTPIDAPAEPFNVHTDQTIFISYYKAKTRFILPAAIKANAGPDVLPDPDSDGDTGEATEVLEYPATSTFESFLEPALDFVLEKLPQVNEVIVCDEDIYDIVDNEEWPEDLGSFLRAKARADAFRIDADDTFATFSIQDWLEKRQREREQSQTEELAQIAANAPPTAADDDNHDDHMAGGYGGDFDDDDDDMFDSEDKRKRPFAGDMELAQPDMNTSSLFPHVNMLGSGSEELGMLCSIAVSSDGKYVLGGYEGGTAMLWRVNNGVALRRFEGHENSVTAVAISPDTRLVATASMDGKVFLRQVENLHIPGAVPVDTQGIITSLEGHTGGIWDAVWSPDNTILATASADSTIILWSISPDTYPIPAGSTTTSPQQPQKIATLRNPSSTNRKIRFSPDSSKLVTLAFDKAIVWDTRTGVQIASLSGHENFIWMADFSHDSSRIVTCSDDHSTRIWDATTGTELVTLREHTASIWCAGFSPDSQWVFSGSCDSAIAVCDSFQSTRKLLLREHSSAVNDVKWLSLDGADYIVGGFANGKVIVWDADWNAYGERGRLVRELKGHEDKVKSVMVTKDKQWIVSGSDDGTVKAWNVIDLIASDAP
ncbi:WD40 repeat-like protein [Panus rudis PR-1116 ss-1]|nr:WD40 repeat-like protein [Panus rudis PR-1116 ss-1]